MARATVLAMAGSIGSPRRIVFCRLSKTSVGSRFSIVSPVKVSAPKRSVTDSASAINGIGGDQPSSVWTCVIIHPWLWAGKAEQYRQSGHNGKGLGRSNCTSS
jgi:hypothetical protein